MDNYIEVKEWSDGVISSMPADHIPNNAMPLGVNTAFRSIGGGQTSVGTRPGMTLANSTALSGTPEIRYQTPYNFFESNVWTRYLVTVGSDGKLYYKNEDNTYTSALAPPANYPAPSGLCFTAFTDHMNATVMNNRLYLTNEDGEKRSLVGEDYVPWGLTPYATWATSDDASAGGNSMPAETYDVTVTSYNSLSGGESSSSTIKNVTLAANRRVKVSITPTAGESAQYTHWKVYLRRQSTQAKLYQVLVFEDTGGAAVTAPDGLIPIATTSVWIDASAATIAALILEAPSTTENNPPPTGIRHVIAYGRRLIVTDGRYIYWSKEDRGDNFRPEDYEPIEDGKGNEIEAFFQFSDNLLLIFLTNSVWGIYGTDPQTWTFNPIDTTVGTSAMASIISANGRVFWWADRIGPVLYDGNVVARIGQELLGSDAVVDDVSSSRQSSIQVGRDERGARIVWSFTSTTGTRNDRLLPYNYRLGKFEATYWDPMDIASLSEGVSSDGTQRLFVGNYEGQIFYFDDTVYLDAVPSGTSNGTFAPATTSITTITSTGFYTTGAGLAERKVLVCDSDDIPIAQRIILSNNSTTLTLNTAITNLVVGQTYTFYVGGPNFRFYSKWFDHDQPFLRKRFDRVYIHLNSETGSVTSTVSTQIEFLDVESAGSTAFTVDDSLWDVGLWDVATWTGNAALKRRIPIFRSATALRVVIYSFMPGRDLIIHKIALLSRLLSDRYYGTS